MCRGAISHCLCAQEFDNFSVRGGAPPQASAGALVIAPPALGTMVNEAPPLPGTTLMMMMIEMMMTIVIG